MSSYQVNKYITLKKVLIKKTLKCTISSGP